MSTQGDYEFKPNISDDEDDDIVIVEEEIIFARNNEISRSSRYKDDEINFYCEPELDWKLFDEQYGYDKITTKSKLGSLKGLGGQFEWQHENAVYIGRRVENDYWQLPESDFANPFTSKVYKSSQKCCELYEEKLWNSPKLLAHLVELDGFKLMCWCSSSSSTTTSYNGENKRKRNKQCHGYILLCALNELRYDAFVLIMRKYTDTDLSEKSHIAQRVLNDIFLQSLNQIIRHIPKIGKNCDNAEFNEMNRSMRTLRALRLAQQREIQNALNV